MGQCGGHPLTPLLALDKTRVGNDDIWTLSHIPALIFRHADDALCARMSAGACGAAHRGSTGRRLGWENYSSTSACDSSFDGGVEPMHVRGDVSPEEPARAGPGNSTDDPTQDHPRTGQNGLSAAQRRDHSRAGHDRRDQARRAEAAAVFLVEPQRPGETLTGPLNVEGRIQNPHSRFSTCRPSRRPARPPLTPPSSRGDRRSGPRS